MCSIVCLRWIKLCNTGIDVKNGLFARSSSDGLLGILCSFSINHTWDECNWRCMRPCRESRYDVVVTSPSGWPHQSYHRAFYDAYVRDASFADRLNQHARETVSGFFLTAGLFFSLVLVIRLFVSGINRKRTTQPIFATFGEYGTWATEETVRFWWQLGRRYTRLG